MTIKEVKIKIDDKEVTVPSNWTVIKACHENGIEVPHYCYHPDLSIAGNCRICMVGVKGAPRPVVACAQPITENMEVTTKGKDIEEARKSVMEFMLINHPLDCPECDQAGECRLQDYSYDYGRDHGRFHEEKVVKSKATMGPHVKYWGSRCIVCTRCVRFTDEVSGTGDLGVIYRGDRSEIALFPGKTMDNPLSMNTVDICPVGALVSSDFLYQTRVWNLKSADSMCSDCAVGCNTRVDFDAKGTIKRIVPRRNDKVNKEWMCDYGRLSFPYAQENRLMKPLVDGRDAPYKDARKAALELLAKKSVVILVSAWNTNEAFAAVKEFAEMHLPGAGIAGYANPGRADEKFPGFTISGDKNPNRKGMQEILGIDAEVSLKELAADTARIGTLVMVHNIPGYAMTPELKAVLDRTESVILLDHAKSDLLKYGNVAVALPTLTTFEKAGTFVNKDGIAQVFQPAMEPANFGRSEAEMFQDFARELSAAAAVTGAVAKVKG
ncbi:MAG: 2Fe-2S iron-sulfur cluster-binding protein [Fibrobacteria bacterium]